MLFTKTLSKIKIAKTITGKYVPWQCRWRTDFCLKRAVTMTDKLLGQHPSLHGGHGNGQYDHYEVLFGTCVLHRGCICFLPHVEEEEIAFKYFLSRLSWWTPTAQWRPGPTPHRGRTTREKAWIQNMMIMINGTPDVRGNALEDLFCCTKKERIQKKQTDNKKQIFSCECPAFSCDYSVFS